MKRYLEKRCRFFVSALGVCCALPATRPVGHVSVPAGLFPSQDTAYIHKAGTANFVSGSECGQGRRLMRMRSPACRTHPAWCVVHPPGARTPPARQGRSGGGSRSPACAPAPFNNRRRRGAAPPKNAKKARRIAFFCLKKRASRDILYNTSEVSGGLIAQSAEHRPFKAVVPGSSPGQPTTFFAFRCENDRFF